MSDGGPSESPVESPGSAGQLTVYLGENVVHEFRLTMPVLTIGRAPDNILPLPDPKVSSHHAELRQTSGGTVLTDLGSRNGTLVDGVRIPSHQPYLLLPGGVFFVGSYGCVYVPAEALEPSSADAPPPTAALPSTEEPPAPAIAAATPPELEAAHGRVTLPPPVPAPPQRPTHDPP